ncbi:hypothetical protein BST61_g10825 [Cercospora zeina]
MAAKTTAAAIFEGLKGSWRLRRSLNSQLAGFPSGTFEGIAKFTPRTPTAHSAAGELVYSEQGELKTDTGFTLRANRKYVYRYDADEDKISAWFIKEDTKAQDGAEEVDYLFHDLEIDSQGNGVAGRGEHLCELDMYWAYYEFRLPKVAEVGDDEKMNVFGVRYKVKGPQKDYTSDTAYTRTFSDDVAVLLESTLLEDDRDDGSIRKLLFSYLTDGSSLTNLRLSSHLLKDLVDQRKSQLFRRLHVRLPLGHRGSSSELTALRRISPFCTGLAIVIMSNDFPTTALVGPGKDASKLDSNTHMVEKLGQMLAQLQNVRELFIRVGGEPSWPGPSPTEDILIALRLALQRAKLPKLRALHLDPVHAAGVLYLRWAGYGAFSASMYSSHHTKLPSTHIWANMTELDLRIRNPAATRKLSDNQMMMFLQVLEDYLRSFHRTIRCLRFVWLDAPGPSPLILGDLLERRHLVWRSLREFCYGGINGVKQSLEVLPVRMPSVNSVKVLRASNTSSSEIWDALQLPKGKKAVRAPMPRTSHYTEESRSKISLMPAPLAVAKRNDAVHPALRSRRASIAYSVSTVFDVPDIDQAIKDITDASKSSSVVESTQPRLVPKFRMPVASSVYSCDEDGNYIPIRQKWDKNRQSVSTAQQGALMDFGGRLEKALEVSGANNASPSDAALVNDREPRADTKPVTQLVNQGRHVGHEPPTVPPASSIARKNHVDLSQTPAYQAARNQHLQEIHEIQLGQSARIRQWAQDVKKGRPPSFVTTKSIRTVSTTGSRPFTKFIEHLRETGRPSRR